MLSVLAVHQPFYISIKYKIFYGHERFPFPIGTLSKLARTASAVNRQLNFTVKHKPHTTKYTIQTTAYLKHILRLKACERTVLTVLKSILSNTFHCGECCRRPEDVKIMIFPSSASRNLLGVGKRYSRMTSKQSIEFFHTLLIIEYASNMQYI